MKKLFLFIGIAISSFSCNQASKEQSTKTAFVDTVKLFKEYKKVQDLESKYKDKSEKMGKNLDSLYQAFQSEVQDFQKNAQIKGADWAKKKQSELMAKEQQLQGMQQSLGQSLQQESATEMDSLYKGVKKFIGDYGKKNGYTYIYGTGEPASVLYGKEELDITTEIIKELNK